MRDSLLGSLVGELSHHLHFMLGLLESLLVGCDIYHVTSPKGVCLSVGGHSEVTRPRTCPDSECSYHKR